MSLHVNIQLPFVFWAFFDQITFLSGVNSPSGFNRSSLHWLIFLSKFFVFVQCSVLDTKDQSVRVNSYTLSAWKCLLIYLPTSPKRFSHEYFRAQSEISSRRITCIFPFLLSPSFRPFSPEGVCVFVVFNTP